MLGLSGLVVAVTPLGIEQGDPYPQMHDRQPDLCTIRCVSSGCTLVIRPRCRRPINLDTTSESVYTRENQKKILHPSPGLVGSLHYDGSDGSTTCCKAGVHMLASVHTSLVFLAALKNIKARIEFVPSHRSPHGIE